MRRLSLFCFLAVLSLNLTAQIYSAEQIEVAPPAPHVAAPDPNASAKELEKRGDELRSTKSYLDALDYFQAALDKDPKKAIKIRPDSAAYYGNLGAAYFGKKDPEKAMAAYIKALELDPDVLSRSSRMGVVGQTTPGEDRAFYDYMVARAYAKIGLFDQSLEHLRKAMEEQYKDIEKVYKDNEFATLRKDPRFLSLMTARPMPLPD
jgi:tetratricopeptide (TPR) repeat protein